MKGAHMERNTGGLYQIMTCLAGETVTVIEDLQMLQAVRIIGLAASPVTLVQDSLEL
jgi:hypothetical protein